jgi:acid stress-induced BolA-like protein IbaG/YrbA
MIAGLVAISEGGHPLDWGIQFNATRMMNADGIRQLIEQGLPGARVQVQGDDGVHFEATVVSDAFRGKLPLARHRLVYATLGERMGGEIHALALKTLTPEEAA